jgi:translation machinery-associated protein 16
MAKSLLKVQQKIQKKKSPLHPKGRKAQLLARASLRDDRVNKKKLIHSMKKSEEIQIFHFFQEFINSETQISKDFFELDDMKILIQAFIDRDNEELKKLKTQRRADRPPSKKQDLLEFRIKQEQHYFQTGWKVPDLRDQTNVTNFRAWNGGHGGLTSINFCIVKKDGIPEDNKDLDHEMS